MVHYVFGGRGVWHESASVCHQRRPVPVVEPPHVLSAQLISPQSCRPFRLLHIRHASHPNLSTPLPIWRLFLSPSSVQNLPHETRQTPKTRTPNPIHYTRLTPPPPPH